MKDKPFFSIVIPTYNRADFIVKTVESTLIQNFHSYEVIVVDDGSTDNTEELIANINSDKIRYFKKSNEERSVARNYGIKQSQGKYVTFLDSDDLLHPDFLKFAYEALEKNKFPEFLNCSYRIIDPSGRLREEKSHVKSNDLKAFIKGNPFSCIGNFVRKDILDEYQFNEDPAMIASEDWELWIRIASRYGFYVDPRIQCTVIDHNQRSVRNFNVKSLIAHRGHAFNSAMNDPFVKEKFKKYFHQIKAYHYTYISLHLSLNGNKWQTLKYLLKAFWLAPGCVFTRRTLAIAKHLLLSWNTTKENAATSITALTNAQNNTSEPEIKNENEIFISLIIPTYNRASLIEPTLISVLKQEYQNFEVIIVDDGSTDNTDEVVERIASDKIRYFKIVNSERGAARNFGIDKAKGDYITFLDSDDILFPNHFSNACESIRKYNKPAFLHLGYEIVNSDNKLLFKIDKLKNDDIYFLNKGNSLSCNGCFLRADVSRQFRFNPDRELTGSEDWELWFRVLANHGIKTDNRISSRMYNHDQRSIVMSLSHEKKLVLRKELALKYAFMDPKVRERYKKYYKLIDAFGDSYISLHLALAGEKKKSMRYLFRFLKSYPAAIFSKRFYVILKCLVFK